MSTLSERIPEVPYSRLWNNADLDRRKAFPPVSLADFEDFEVDSSEGQDACRYRVCSPFSISGDSNRLEGNDPVSLA